MSSKKGEWVNLMERHEMKDRCVICWQETEYAVEAHIRERCHYEEGSGQLCRADFHELYPGQCNCKTEKPN